MIDSIFQINVTKHLGHDYVPMMNDIVRFVSIQVVIQMLLFTMNNNAFPLFSTDFLLLLAFIVLGVLLYHLVIQRLVVFA